MVKPIGVVEDLKPFCLHRLTTSPARATQFSRSSGDPCHVPIRAKIAASSFPTRFNTAGRHFPPISMMPSIGATWDYRESAFHDVLDLPPLKAHLSRVIAWDGVEADLKLFCDP